MKYPLLISDPANIFYLTGISVTSRDAWVLVTEPATHFFTDARYNDILHTFAVSSKTSRLGTPIIGHQISAIHPLSETIRAILEKTATPYIYFESENLTVLELKTLRKKIGLPFKPSKGRIAKYREVKQHDEIEKIRQACKVIDTCLKIITPLLQPGRTEYEIAYKIDSYLREHGHTSAFDPIVAVDEHAAVPHFNTQLHGKKKISQNSIILIDAGAKVDGYCSDITRMFIVGKPSALFMKTYANMLEVQETTISALGKNKKYSEVDALCRSELQRHSITPHTHATGHGIGVEVHERPSLSPNATETIKPHHVVTIEPGTYIEGTFGIRIEDTVLIDDKGKPIPLTQSPKII